MVSPERSIGYSEILKIVRKTKGEIKKKSKKDKFFRLRRAKNGVFKRFFVVKTIDSGEKSRPKGAKIFWALFGENSFVF